MCKYTKIFFLLVLFNSELNASELLVSDSTNVKLSEVVVNAEYTKVKAIGAKLEYNVPALIKNKPVDNAFDILRQIPGLMIQDEDISIIGASKTNILINGRLTTMTLEQLIALLKLTPSDKIKKIELMYNTPPQYGVRGGAINLVMANNKSLIDELKAEIALNATQKTYFNSSSQINLSYSLKKISYDFSYGFRLNQMRAHEIMDGKQTLNDVQYNIEQDNTARNTDYNHQFNGIIDYQPDEKNHFTLNYTGTFNNKHFNRNANTDFVDVDKVFTNNKIKGPSALNSFLFDYSHNNALKAGLDFTLFSENINQNTLNTYANNIDTMRINNTTQRVIKTKAYANYKKEVWNKSEITVGMEMSNTHVDNQAYSAIDNHIETNSTYQQSQNEHTINTFLDFSKQLSKAISIEASLAAEFYEATADSAQTHKTLWRRTDLFPNLSLSNVGKYGTLQLSFSSDKTYPAYFETSPALIYLNAYSIKQGNPLLKPELNYSCKFNYLLFNKYQFGAFATHSPDNIMQMPYQQSNKLQMVFSEINLAFRDSYGVSAFVPFKIGAFVESKINIMSWLQHDKGTLFDLSFDRKNIFSYFSMDNTIFVNKKNDRFISLSGNYKTTAIQGIYSIDPTFDYSAAFVWKISADKARLTLKFEDGQDYNTHINIQNQHNNLYKFRDRKSISIGFRYNINNLKTVNYKEVDQSRFGYK